MLVWQVSLWRLPKPTDKDDSRVEQTEWHNIVLWRGLADVAAKYLSKGRLVYIEGKLRTRTYEDKEGIRRYTTEIIAESFNLLGRRSDFEPQGNSPSGSDSPKPDKGSSEQSVDFKENDDDKDGLPF